jgi:hypothetical protein
MSVAAPIFVAVVADGGAVGVSGNVGVSLVGAGFLVGRGGVAVDAGEAGVVGGDLVAVVADGTVVRDREVGVVKRCTEPAGGGVTSVAGGGIAGGEVVGYTATQCLRAIPGSLVAAVTSGIGGCQGVIAIDVASRAGSFAGIGMSASERPARRRVIKFSVRPTQSVVAGGALGSGKACGDVIGDIAAERLGADPCGLVAAVAVGVGGGEVVVVVDVAIGAGGNFSGGSQLV